MTAIYFKQDLILGTGFSHGGYINVKKEAGMRNNIQAGVVLHSRNAGLSIGSYGFA